MKKKVKFKLLNYYGTIDGSINIADWLEDMSDLHRTMKRHPTAKLLRIESFFTGIALYEGTATRWQVELAILHDLGFSDEDIKKYDM